MNNLWKPTKLVIVILTLSLCASILSASNIRGPVSQFEIEIKSAEGLSKNTSIVLNYSIVPSDELKGKSLDEASMEIKIVEYKNRPNILFQETKPIKLKESRAYEGNLSFATDNSDVLEVKVYLTCGNAIGREYFYIVLQNEDSKILRTHDFVHSQYYGVENATTDTSKNEVEVYHKKASELSTDELQALYYFGFKIENESEKIEVEKVLGDLSLALHHDTYRNVFTVHTTLKNILLLKEIVPDCEISKDEPKILQNLKKNR